VRVVPVPCLADNYAYLVIEGDHAATDGRARCAVVDPGEAAPVVAALGRERVTLAAIWLTHHHHDHVGGVAELVAQHGSIDGRDQRPAGSTAEWRCGPIEVVAHAHDRTRAPGVTRTVDEGDRVTLPGTALTARIVHNPGHTLGAISYVVDARGAEDGAVFTGDTLFAAGCGRLFEGDAAMMFASLAKLAALPPATRVFFGHEYTRNNLAFARIVEPDNAAIADRARTLRVPSTPSTIGAERATNVFVRAHDVAELAERRASKDAFRA
jgi:hydroxyacylglutathione hydrolase